jgi:polysaccharide chain length determinant protein (PEP-CTERM system associated)
MLGHRKLEIPDYLAILKRRRWLLLGCIIVFPLIALGITRFITPRYQSQTLVLIEEQKVPGEFVTPIISTNIDSRLSSMKEQILSRSRIQPIIEKYNLYGTNHMNMDDRIDATRKSIDIRPIHSVIANAGGLPGFFISFTSTDAHTAQLVCGEITTLFLNENLKTREEEVEGTNDFLKSQLADAKRSLDDQDAKLAAFQHKYFGKLPGEESGNINMLTSLNTQLEAATQSLARMESDKIAQEGMLAQQVQAQAATVNGTAPASQNPVAQAQRTRLQSLQNQEADLLNHYTAEYPDVVAVRRQISDLRKEMAQTPATLGGGGGPAGQREGDSIAIQQLRSQIRAADVAIQAKRREQDGIQAQVRMYQERIASSPEVEEEYKDLTRDYTTAQKFYDELLTKIERATLGSNLEKRQEGEQFRMMDPPNLPDSPFYPKPMVFAMGGLAFGLTLALSITGFLEYKDTALRTERDVWAFTRLPTLGVISVAGEVKAEKPASSGGFFRRRKKQDTDIKSEKESLVGANG